MPNILDEYNATSEQRIDDKTDLYSVTTIDVGQTIREGVALGVVITETIVGKTYPKGWRAIDSSSNLYIAKLDNVSHDVTNTTNWKNISSGATEPYKIEIECDGVQEIYPIPHDTENDAPVGALYVEDAFGDWQPLDWTQGIKATSPNDLSFNTMAYLGNAFGLKYKITVASGDSTTPSSNGITRTVESTSTNDTAGSATLTDYVYFLTGSNTLTLPSAVGNTNRYLIIRKSGSVVSIASTSSQTFNGVAGPINLNVDKIQIELISDGSNWTY